MKNRLVLFFFVFMFTACGQTSPSATPGQQTKLSVTKVSGTSAATITTTTVAATTDWRNMASVDGDFYVRGDPKAPVRVIDYSDFLCPTCRAYTLRVEPQLLTNYVAKGLVSFAFSPVLDFGQPSLLASKTAECAGKTKLISFLENA